MTCSLCYSSEQDGLVISIVVKEIMLKNLEQSTSYRLDEIFLSLKQGVCMKIDY